MSRSLMACRRRVRLEAAIAPRLDADNTGVPALRESHRDLACRTACVLICPAGCSFRQHRPLSPQGENYFHRGHCCVLHSVAAPARVNRAALPLIQNSMAPLAYLPPSAESTCGSFKGRRHPAKVSRTEPVGPGGLKTAWTAVPSAHRYAVSVANAELTAPINATHAIINLMPSFLSCHHDRGQKNEFWSRPPRLASVLPISAFVVEAIRSPRKVRGPNCQVDIPAPNRVPPAGSSGHFFASVKKLAIRADEGIPPLP
jgi:hypothetical protein